MSSTTARMGIARGQGDRGPSIRRPVAAGRGRRGPQGAGLRAARAPDGPPHLWRVLALAASDLAELGRRTQRPAAISLWTIGLRRSIGHAATSVVVELVISERRGARAVAARRRARGEDRLPRRWATTLATETAARLSIARRPQDAGAGARRGPGSALPDVRRPAAPARSVRSGGARAAGPASGGRRPPDPRPCGIPRLMQR